MTEVSGRDIQVDMTEVPPLSSDLVRRSVAKRSVRPLVVAVLSPGQDLTARIVDVAYATVTDVADERWLIQELDDARRVVEDETSQR